MLDPEGLQCVACVHNVLNEKKHSFHILINLGKTHLVKTLISQNIPGSKVDVLGCFGHQPANTEIVIHHFGLNLMCKNSLYYHGPKG